MKVFVTYFNEKRKTTPTREIDFPIDVVFNFIKGTNIPIWNVIKIDVKKPEKQTS